MRLAFVRFCHPVTDTSFKGHQEARAGANGVDELDITGLEGDSFVRIRATPRGGKPVTVLVPMYNVSYLVPAEVAEVAPAKPSPAPVEVPVRTTRAAIDEAPAPTVIGKPKKGPRN